MKRLLSSMIFLLIFTGNQVSAEDISIDETINWMNKNTQHLEHDYVFSAGSHCELITKFTFRNYTEDNCNHKNYTPMEKVNVETRGDEGEYYLIIDLTCKQDKNCATVTSNQCIWRRTTNGSRKYVDESKLAWGSVISIQNKTYVKKYINALKNFQKQCLKRPKDLF